jgi:hypothetical protein
MRRQSRKMAQANVRSNHSCVHQHQQYCFRYSIWSDDENTIESLHHGSGKVIPTPQLLATTTSLECDDPFHTDQLRAVCEIANLVVDSKLSTRYCIRKLPGTISHIRLLCGGNSTTLRCKNPCTTGSENFRRYRHVKLTHTHLRC